MFHVRAGLRNGPAVCVQTQMRKGFERVQRSLDDLVLDYPHARDMFARLSEQAKAAGWLTTDG